MKSFREMIEGTDDGGEAEFHARLRRDHPDGVEGYHESPGHVADSIRTHGLDSSRGGGDHEGTFFSIGAHSNFVRSPKKTITRFVIPHTHSHDVTYDMGYDNHSDLLRQHGGVNGAYAYYRGNIPRHWIKSVEEHDG